MEARSLERGRLKLVPWGLVKYWRCVRCGACCQHTTVQLTPPEWLRLVKSYGFGIVEQNISGFYLRKTLNDQCPFLYPSVSGWSCKLQHVKPLACKLWPFRIRATPTFGDGDAAYFKYRQQEFYVYAYPQCPGLVLGKPSRLLSSKILPEFLDIRMGLQKQQVYSTSKLP